MRQVQALPFGLQSVHGGGFTAVWVVAGCFAAGVFGGEPCRADVACWGGWGPHTPCARQIGPHPPQPTPPSRHGPLRCVWGRRQKYGLPFAPRLHLFSSLFACQLFPFPACPRIPVQAHTGSHGRGVSRSDNLCSQRAEDGSPLVRAQSAATPPPNLADRAEQPHSTQAEKRAHDHSAPTAEMVSQPQCLLNQALCCTPS